MPKVTVKLQVEKALAPPPPPEEEGKPKKRAPKSKGSKEQFVVSLDETDGDIALLVSRPAVPRKYSPGQIQRVVLAIAWACMSSGARLRFDVDIDLPGLQNPSLRHAVGRCIKASERPKNGRY